MFLRIQGAMFVTETLYLWSRVFVCLVVLIEV